MRPSDPVASAVVYRRAPGAVFRWTRGAVLVGGPRRPTQKLDGVAALVWMVLDTPASEPDVSRRLHLDWPEVGGGTSNEISSALVAEALALLVAAGLISADNQPGSATVTPDNS